MLRSITRAVAPITCFVVSVAAAPAAQTLNTQDIHAKLQSGDPQQVAWGAHLAAQHHVSQVADALWFAMTTTPEAGDWILDALIQLRAKLPASYLLGTYDQWPIHTLVLLGDSRFDRNQVLHGLFNRARGHQWFAIANLLLQTKSPALAGALLRELRLTLHVSIVSDRNGFGTGGGFGGAIACGIVAGLHDGYPPRALYRFAAPQRGAVLLANGPHPVYYLRTVVGSGDQTGSSESGLPGPTPRDRLDYLASLAVLNQFDMPLHADTFVSVHWSGQEAFDREIAAARADIEYRYRMLLQRLVDYRRIGADEATSLSPAIDVDVTDRRK